MKTITQSIRTLLLLSTVGTSSVLAQSCAAVNTLGNASGHAVNASGEVLASGAASAVAVGQTASAVVAVPVWTGGSVVAASGQIANKTGTAMTKGADKMWDFATNDGSPRPKLDRDRSVPPAPTPAAKAKDPSPADALKQL